MGLVFPGLNFSASLCLSSSLSLRDPSPIYSVAGTKADQENRLQKCTEPTKELYKCAECAEGLGFVGGENTERRAIGRIRKAAIQHQFTQKLFD